MCLFAFGCGLASPRPGSGGHWADPVDNCVANIVVLAGPVSRPNQVLGYVQGEGYVISPSATTAMWGAAKDACTAHPDANAVINFSGGVQGNTASWSGVVVKWQ
jgi:hypothetical protein